MLNMGEGMAQRAIPSVGFQGVVENPATPSHFWEEASHKTQMLLMPINHAGLAGFPADA